MSGYFVVPGEWLTPAVGVKVNKLQSEMEKHADSALDIS